MAEITSINPADLRAIENNLNAIHNNLSVLDSNVETVNDNVKIVYDEIGQLAKDFHEFINIQIKANRLGQAETRLVKIRQELKDKYGHYDIVRRTTTGILQANDLGVVKKDTITTATENLMISTPNYWLAPCLVALASWINDNQELAEKALREAISRNDEKTSLFFALVCRRADRKQASLKWTQRYLASQDETQLDRKTVIILDAFASGLFGSDTEGVVSRQMGEWLDRLSATPGFLEKQRDQWSAAINLRKKPLADSSYVYLKSYSHTWPAIADTLEGAGLHAEIFDYFTKIFDQMVSNQSLKEQLDDILNELVTDFDDEELPLRREEKFEDFVVKYKGDEKRAKKSMDVEETAFTTHKDFTQLLTDAAMKPESANASVSTQKFAIALSKDWIMEAYEDIIAKNRMKIPAYIEINVDTFNDRTEDGKNEEELLMNFNTLVNNEKNAALARAVLTAFEQYCLVGGAIVAAIGLIMLIAQQAFWGIVAIVAGIGAVINHFSKKSSVEQQRANISAKFEEKRENGIQIIRAVTAEVVDYRAEFRKKDAESQKVLDFLDQLAPEQYVRRLADSNRRVKI